MPLTRFKNNARSTLFSGISAVATAMTVQPGHGDRFPVADVNNIFYLTLEDSAKNYEIVKVTARAAGSDSLTIVRSQESSTARAFIAGVIVGLRATAGLLELAMNAQVNLDTHAAASDPHPQYATDADLSAHAAAADPHPGYLTPAEGAAAYAALGHTHQTSANIAANATTMNPWGVELAVLTGAAVNFTGIAAAPQPGAEVELVMNAAHTFTHGAVFEVDGNVSWTATIGDRAILRAKSTTVMIVHPRKKDGTAIVSPPSGGVTAFNTRTGAVTLSSADVTGALAYTPSPNTHAHSGVYVAVDNGEHAVGEFIVASLDAGANVVAGATVAGSRLVILSVTAVVALPGTWRNINGAQCDNSTNGFFQRIT